MLSSTNLTILDTMPVWNTTFAAMEVEYWELMQRFDNSPQLLLDSVTKVQHNFSVLLLRGDHKGLW